MLLYLKFKPICILRLKEMFLERAYVAWRVADWAWVIRETECEDSLGVYSEDLQRSENEAVALV
jgi:hypothetical protein